ncbi:MAG: MauE/DoxX family redox-associated membrane protein [Ignavibacteria bacterium]
MPLKIFDNKYFGDTVRVILGILFIYASLDKIASMSDFAKVIHNYRLLPVSLENLFAIFLPWIEFITGMFLIVGKFSKGSLLIYSSLLVIFIIALFQAQLRGLDINCGCFSVNPSSTSNIWMRIFLDLIMLFFSVNLYLSIKEEKIQFSEETS